MVDAVAASLVAGAVIAVVVGALLVVASRQPFPASVVAALTILGTLALGGYTVAGEARPELAAIAGTAVGALAGGATTVLSNTTRDASTGEADADG